MSDIRIHTLGDSTIDNLYWVINRDAPDVQEAKPQTVEGELQKKCLHDTTRKYEVISHAFDGFTTDSVLNGDHVGRVLPGGRVKQHYMKEKIGDGDTFVRPLDKLKQSIEEKPQARHFVVLSVGGNDFRENLINPLRLLWNISSIQNRYIQIAQEIKNIKNRDVRPIFMLQYKTDKNNDPYYIYPLMKWLGFFAKTIQYVALAALLGGAALTLVGKISLVVGVVFIGLGTLGIFYTNKLTPITQKVDPVQTFDKLAEIFYKPILAYAKKEQTPVLDLTHTFDPNKPLYTCGIEPNVQGGQLIAEGIHHIVTHHDYSGPSMLYTKPENGSYTGVVST